MPASPPSKPPTAPPAAAPMAMAAAGGGGGAEAGDGTGGTDHMAEIARKVGGTVTIIDTRSVFEL